MRLATCPITKTSEETWILLLKQSAALAATIVVASALAYGNSIASADSDSSLISHTTQSTQNTMTGGRDPIQSKEFAGFRSTLHGGHRDSARVLMTKANGSRFADMAKEAESTTAMPEPSTGILLTVGLFAAINLRSRAVAIRRLQELLRGTSR